MTKHQTAAYGVMCDTAEKLRALIVAVRSNQLSLPNSAIDSLVIAVNAIHTAQRELEAQT